jgi:hypothetical protein
MMLLWKMVLSLDSDSSKPTELPLAVFPVRMLPELEPRKKPTGFWKPLVFPTAVFPVRVLSLEPDRLKPMMLPLEVFSLSTLPEELRR